MELPHENIAQKMRDLGGRWTTGRYETLVKALGKPYSEISMGDVMTLCARKYGFCQPSRGSSTWVVVPEK